MGLRLKFNLVLLVVFVLGLGVTAYISWTLLQKNAREEVVRNADLMMEAALAIRAYTVDQVRPQLDLQLMRVFLPQSVPAYAATETLNQIEKKYADYSYKEATLNPTNPRNRAAEWEADLDPRVPGTTSDLTEMIRRARRLRRAGPCTSRGPSGSRTRPVCRATPLRRWRRPPWSSTTGPANGFGWKLNDIIGAQVVSVPMTVPIRNASARFSRSWAPSPWCSSLVFVVLNVMLSRMIVRPISLMSRAADQVSTGDFDVAELPETGQGRDRRARPGLQPHAPEPPEGASDDRRLSGHGGLTSAPGTASARSSSPISCSTGRSPSPGRSR